MYTFRGKCSTAVGRIINMLVLNFVAVAVYHRQNIIVNFVKKKEVLQLFSSKPDMIFSGIISLFGFYSLRRMSMTAETKQQHTWLSKNLLLDLFNKGSRYGIIDVLVSIYYGDQA